MKPPLRKGDRVVTRSRANAALELPGVLVDSDGHWTTIQLDVGGVVDRPIEEVRIEESSRKD